MFHPIKEEKSGLNIKIRNKFEDYSSISPRLDAVHDYKSETKHRMNPFLCLLHSAQGRKRIDLSRMVTQMEFRSVVPALWDQGSTYDER